VRDICRADGMPAACTVRLWVVADRDGFEARFARARRFAHLDMAEELPEILDDGRNDWMESRAREGDPAAAHYRESVRRSRLRFEGRCRILSKELPEIYGNRIAPAKEEANNDMAELLKLLNGRDRGLPSEERPVDESDLEKLDREDEDDDGLPTDRL
jgi:hypothetical protein